MFFEIDATRKIQVQTLKRLLPDIETAIFFGKVYKFPAKQLGELLMLLFDTPLITALTEGMHSTELQDYILELDYQAPEMITFAEDKQLNLTAPDGELLVHLWDDSITEVAASITQVADKLVGVLDRLPSKEGQLTFQQLRKFNARRGSLGVYEAGIRHNLVPNVAVILDVSGSMSASTIQAIVQDVVALTWKTNAHLFTVSNDAHHWEPGASSVDAVLNAAAYAGTHYETLVPMLDQNWGTVVTIADYDSSPYAKTACKQAKGQVGQVLDISLVDQPTFLSECIKTRSPEPVKHLLMSNRSYPL